jgi:hypothetical protein
MIAPILTITEIATESMIPEKQKKNTTVTNNNMID